MAGDTPQNNRDPNFDVALSTRSSQATVASILAQLDVALSTRASEATVASILVQLDVALSTRSSQATVASILTQLDVTQTVQTRLSRWGKNIDPAWVHAVEVVAPAAATALVTKAVTAGKTGYIYGFLITAQEGNDFLLAWTSGGVARSIRISYGGKGTVESVDVVPMNEGLGADATTNITISNVTAGTVGLVYQARLLYAEV